MKQQPRVMVGLDKTMKSLDPQQKLAVLCDFDESLAEQNVAETVLTHCGDSSWPEVRERFRRREITLREYQEAVFRSLGRKREEMARVVRERCSARPHVSELWALCQRRGFALEIVTNGLDFYVEALLERERMVGLPYLAVRSDFAAGGISYRYSEAPAHCDHAASWGICKCDVVERYHGSGHFVAYVGDGTSDVCPAVKSDFVFARSKLLEICQERKLPHQPFEDFAPVLDFAQRWPESRPLGT